MMKNNLYLWDEIGRGHVRLKGEVPTLSHLFFWYIILTLGTMQEIQLCRQSKNKGKFVALVNDEDYDYLNQFRWWVCVSYEKVYVIGRGKSKDNPRRRYYMHRIIMRPPDGMEVDHIDGNGLNNQRNNLRICTHQQNQHNQTKITGKSKYKGVHFLNGKYIKAQISFNGKIIYLGHFKTEVDAARAYDKKAKELFGEFANFNFK